MIAAVAPFSSPFGKRATVGVASWTSRVRISLPACPKQGRGAWPERSRRPCPEKSRKAWPSRVDAIAVPLTSLIRGCEYETRGCGHCSGGGVGHHGGSWWCRRAAAGIQGPGGRAGADAGPDSLRPGRGRHRPDQPQGRRRHLPCRRRADGQGGRGLHQGPPGPQPDRLRFDFTGKGAFNDTQVVPIHWMSPGGQAGRGQFGPTVLAVQEAGRTLSVTVSGMCMATGSRGGPAYVLRASFVAAAEGPCQFGEKSRTVRVVDGGNLSFRDGLKLPLAGPLYSALLRQYADKVIVLKDDGTVDTWSYYGQPVRVDGQWYVVSVSDDQASVSAAKLDAPMAELRPEASRLVGHAGRSQIRTGIGRGHAADFRPGRRPMPWPRAGSMLSVRGAGPRRSSTPATPDPWSRPRPASRPSCRRRRRCGAR